MHIRAQCDVNAEMQCTALVWHPFPLGMLISLPPPVSLLAATAPSLSPSSLLIPTHKYTHSAQKAHGGCHDIRTSLWCFYDKEF